ncbi:MAG: antitoxin Xre/MbcA/ParS toxin-binding domain-containing protein [Spartobacteria bacterium]
MKAPVKGKKATPVKKSPARPIAVTKKAAPKTKGVLPAKSAPQKPGKVSAGGGLAFDEFEALRRQLDLSLEELSARLGLTRDVVEERKAAGRLTSDESGKVVCFARLLGHAVHLFGGLEEARQWLKAPQRGLHGAVPLDYAKTDLGAREVENLLSRLRVSA